MVARRFEAVLGGETGERPMVEIPFDVKTTFGSARPPVKVTVNGVELRTTVCVYGGRSFVGFRKEIREAAGIAVGDRVRVCIEADTAPREVALPVELAGVLDAAPDAQARFFALSFTHQSEYARWVGDGKKAETRERRADKAVEMLRAGQTVS